MVLLFMFLLFTALSFSGLHRLLVDGTPAL